MNSVRCLKYISFFFAMIFFEIALASSSTFTYQGRIMGMDGKPLEYSNVSFEFRILNPAGTCILYREQVSHVDMTNSNGVFDTPIGAGTKLYPSSTTIGLIDVFSNKGILSCEGGSTYTPLADHGRVLRVQFHDGNGWKQISPDNEIRSVPYSAFSLNALKFADLEVTNFVLKSDVPTAACTASQVVSFDGSKFLCVTDQVGSGASLPTAAGVSGKYLKSDGTSWSGQNITFADIKNLAGTSAFSGMGSCTANQTVKWSALTDSFECQNIGSLPVSALAAGALNALLPSQTSNSGKVLQTDGTNVSWVTPAAGGSSQWTTTGSDIYFDTGKVGIGTNAPTTPLHLVGSALFTGGLTLGGDLFGNKVLLNNQSAATPGYSFVYSSDTGMFEAGTGAHALGISTAGVERLRITNTGNVGIGTTTPAYKFNIAPASNAAAVRIDGGVSAVNGLYMGAGYDTAWISNALSYDGTNFTAHALGTSMIYQSAGNIYFYADYAATGTRVPTSRLYIKRDGNIGIGTTNPTELFHVNGNALATAWNTSSDVRLKENIKEIQDPLLKIVNLRGVEFDWKKDVAAPTAHDQTHDIGVIAQEVEKVFPEAVSSPPNTFKAVAYSKLVAPLIGAVKALYFRVVAVEEGQVNLASRIESLEKENAELKFKNVQFENRLREFESRIQSLEKN